MLRYCQITWKRKEMRIVANTSYELNKSNTKDARKYGYNGEMR